ncbi:hypothetical protein [Streptomyces chryseus]
MPNRPIRLLQASNIAAALLLGTTAIQHAQAALWPQAVAATLITALLIENAMGEAERAAARRRASVAAERRARPRPSATPCATAIGDELTLARQDLAEACCVDSWVTRGAEHDAALCRGRERP